MDNLEELYQELRDRLFNSLDGDIYKELEIMDKIFALESKSNNSQSLTEDDYPEMLIDGKVKKATKKDMEKWIDDVLSRA